MCRLLQKSHYIQTSAVQRQVEQNSDIVT